VGPGGSCPSRHRRTRALHAQRSHDPARQCPLPQTSSGSCRLPLGRWKQSLPSVDCRRHPQAPAACPGGRHGARGRPRPCGRDGPFGARDAGEPGGHGGRPPRAPVALARNCGSREKAPRRLQDGGLARPVGPGKRRHAREPRPGPGCGLEVARAELRDPHGGGRHIGSYMNVKAPGRRLAPIHAAQARRPPRIIYYADPAAGR